MEKENEHRIREPKERQAREGERLRGKKVPQRAGKWSGGTKAMAGRNLK